VKKGCGKSSERKLFGKEKKQNKVKKEGKAERRVKLLARIKLLQYCLYKELEQQTEERIVVDVKVYFQPEGDNSHEEGSDR